MTAAIQHPISYAIILLEMVGEHDSQVDALCQAAHLNQKQLDQTDSLISNDQLQAMLLAAREITQEPSLALRYGKRLPITSHGVLGYALMSCKSLHQALNLLMKYYRLLLDSSYLCMEENGNEVIIEYRDLNPKSIPGHFNEELFFAGIITAIQQLLHLKVLPIQLRFQYPPPKHSGSYREYLGVDASFNHHRNEIVLPLEFLSLQPEFANPSMLKVYQQQCDNLMASMDKHEGLKNAVRRLLISSREQFPKLEKVADHFHMSPRTFRRRLAEEETSFQKISDEIKCGLAESYLQSPGFSVETVGDLLGFNDISNFRRAFIRWTGQSPADFQKSCKQATSKFNT